MRVDGVHRYSRLPSISIDSRREREEGRKIVTWITIETLSDISCSRSKILGFVFPCPFHSKRDGYIENEMPREEWKLNTEVDIRGSSFSVSLRIGAIYVIVV